MIKVYINKQSSYPVSTPALKKRLIAFFEKEGIVSNADVSVSIVGEKRMLELAEKHLQEKEVLHNVLSFTASETPGKFLYPPDNLIHLGDIVICFQKAFEEAKAEQKMIDDKIWELIEHGAHHLLGHHHE
jgi:probable rRNA maturation factor